MLSEQWASIKEGCLSNGLLPLIDALEMYNEVRYKCNIKIILLIKTLLKIAIATKLCQVSENNPRIRDLFVS